MSAGVEERPKRLEALPTLRDGLKEAFVYRVVFDGWREPANDLQHAAGQDFVPAEIAFYVCTVGTQAHGIPDGHTGFDVGGV
jgi:hypothetical protein